MSMLRLALIAVVASSAVSSAWAQEPDEYVVVDQDELNQYWRPDLGHQFSVSLSGDQVQVYGCMTVPFSINSDGVVGPGLRPLMLRLGSAQNVEALDTRALYELAVGALPRFNPTWGTGPSDTIYSSHAVVFTDESLVTRLGAAQVRSLRQALARACRIDGLARWHESNGTSTVSQPLPADPAQWLATQQQAD